jgi:hypothetical protein
VDEEDNLISKLDDKTYVFDDKINFQDLYRPIKLKDRSSFDEISTENPPPQEWLPYIIMTHARGLQTNRLGQSRQVLAIGKSGQSCKARMPFQGTPAF